ncbi:XdhC family protein [Sagittula sp. S175]|uniref:XdhC family protein n=1 Tax=Sagittula sp. S175 TaxID=3415129 RepID=UPI003C7A5FED
MSKFDIFDTIATLRSRGRPFCVATVVRTADVTSAKAGAKAAITETGEILGHLGGGCVTRAVREAATTALTSNETAMIRVKPSANVLALTDADGAQVFRSGCPSGGTVDILIEPYELPAMLALFGTTPIARAIALHANLAGFRVACDPELDLMGMQSLEDLADLRPQDFVVIATQGAGDLAALKTALASPARRVSMIASAKKAHALTAKLDLPQQVIARLKSPAGLDLGGIDPHEIAVSVLAEIIQWRARDARPQEDVHETTA